MAPIGYLNAKKGEEKIVAIDPVRGKYIQKAFEMYATGLHTFQSISDALYQEGLRTKSKKRGGVKVRKGAIHRIINNTFYYGLMFQQGKYYQGRHEPLIDKNLFERCQQVLNGVKKPKNKKHTFLFRGLCSCAECGCSITAEKQKGYSYYHCTNGKGICDQKKKYIRQYQLESQLFHAIFHYADFNQEILQIVQQSA